jgi:hypothetical protein
MTRQRTVLGAGQFNTAFDAGDQAGHACDGSGGEKNLCVRIHDDKR